MADGRHVGKYSKCHNSLTNKPTEMQLGWSYPIKCSTCPPCCGCHGNGCCLATAHWTFCSYGRLEAERVNQFWLNWVRNIKLGPQWQSRDQILKFLKFEWRTAAMLENIRNAITRLPMDQLGCSLGGRIPSCSRHVRHNAVCLATAHWTFSSYGRLKAERVNQFWWNLVYNSKFGQQWQSRDQILNIQNGGRSLLENIRNATTRLPMDRLGRNLGCRIPSCSQYWKCYNSSYDGTDWDCYGSKQHIYCKTVSLVLVFTANRTVNVLVFWGCRDQKHLQFWWNLDDSATVVQKNKIW